MRNPRPRTEQRWATTRGTTVAHRRSQVVRGLHQRGRHHVRSAQPSERWPGVLVGMLAGRCAAAESPYSACALALFLGLMKFPPTPGHGTTITYLIGPTRYPVPSCWRRKKLSTINQHGFEDAFPNPTVTLPCRPPRSMALKKRFAPATSSEFRWLLRRRLIASQSEPRS